MSIPDLIVLIPLLVTCFAWIQVWHRRGRTTGTIFNIAYDHGRVRTVGRKSWHLHIRFYVDGQEFTFVPAVTTIFDTRQKNVGMPVPVAYNLTNPQDADLATPLHRYGGPVGLTLFTAFIVYVRFFQS
jgi:hypothetical protein